MITFAWIAATIWADARGKNPVMYGLFAFFFSIIETAGFWTWMTK